MDQLDRHVSSDVAFTKLGDPWRLNVADLEQVRTDKAGGAKQWVTVFEASSDKHTAAADIEKPATAILRAVKARAALGDSGVGERLEFSRGDLLITARGDALEDLIRAPEAHTACHIPVSCEDPLSLFFLAVADSSCAVVWLLASFLIWAFIGLFILWLARKRDGAILYKGSRTEWVLIVVVLCLQGIPSVLDFIKPWKKLPSLRKFIGKVQPQLRPRMYLCLVVVTADLLQPIALTALSIYIALYLSDSELITALLNVAVLAFVATLDTALLKRFIEWQYGEGYHISLAFLDVIYRSGFATLDSHGDIESFYYRHSGRSREEILDTLRSKDTTLDQKWEALMDVDRGIGILAMWPDEAAQGVLPVVQSVVVDVSLFSWAEVQDACGPQSRLSSISALCDKVKDFLGKAFGGALFARWQSTKPYRLWCGDPRIGWLLEGASEWQWTSEIDQFVRMWMLKFYPEKVSRFPFAGVVYLRQMDLRLKHVRAVAKMMNHSHGLAKLDLSDNPGIGDEGATILAQALLKNDTLPALALMRCGIGEKGAKELLEALKRNPQALSNGLCLGDPDKEAEGVIQISSDFRKEFKDEMTRSHRCDPFRDVDGLY